MGKENKYDYIIIGSGFGGSVSAMRLAEKGYDVLVLEKGKKYTNDDFPKSSWQIKKFLWLPIIRCFGITKLSIFKKALVLSGVGVGGGSLVYANVHMKPPASFYKTGHWAGLADWENILAPHFEKARFMLGSAPVTTKYPEDKVLEEIALDMNNHSGFSLIDYVGVYFGDKDHPTDPYFKGLGPNRLGCTECAGCMTGCRYNAKNTLDKNYLHFAQKFGAIIKSKSEVVKIKKTKSGYEIFAKEGLGWLKKNRKIYQTSKVIVSAGVLGTMNLLMKQKHKYGTLPNISITLGENLRTNSETICGVAEADRKLNNGIAISSAFQVNEFTAVQLCKYPDGSGTLGRLAVLATPNAPMPLRILKLIGITLRHPVKFLRYYFSRSFASKSVYILVMQSMDNSMKMVWKRGLFKKKMKMAPGDGIMPPAYIAEGQEIMNRYAEKVNGIPLNSAVEVLFGMSTTAHILGGCKMSDSVERGVIDLDFQLHGYPGIYILDGSIIQSNPGVNPSLSITAISEYANSLIPKKKGHDLPSFDQLLAEKKV